MFQDNFSSNELTLNTFSDEDVRKRLLDSLSSFLFSFMFWTSVSVSSSFFFLFLICFCFSITCVISVTVSSSFFFVSMYLLFPVMFNFNFLYIFSYVFVCSFQSYFWSVCVLLSCLICVNCAFFISILVSFIPIFFLLQMFSFCFLFPFYFYFNCFLPVSCFSFSYLTIFSRSGISFSFSESRKNEECSEKTDIVISQ